MIDKKLIQLCEMLGIEVCDLRLTAPRSCSYFMASYNHTRDAISLNPPYFAEHRETCANLILLHEIGHWTGHQNRLNRISVKSPKHNSKEYATEEITAQYFMFYAAQWLGYDWSKSFKHLVGYIKLHTLSKKGDLIRGEYLAKVAFEWFKKQVELHNNDKIAA